MSLALEPGLTARVPPACQHHPGAGFTLWPEAWREPLRLSTAAAAGTGAEGPGWGWEVAEWSCVHALALPPLTLGQTHLS